MKPNILNLALKVCNHFQGTFKVVITRGLLQPITCLYCNSISMAEVNTHCDWRQAKNLLTCNSNYVQKSWLNSCHYNTWHTTHCSSKKPTSYSTTSTATGNQWSNPPYQSDKYTSSVPILFKNLREDLNLNIPTTVESKQLGSSRLTTERIHHATELKQEWHSNLKFSTTTSWGNTD